MHCIKKILHLNFLLFGLLLLLLRIHKSLRMHDFFSNQPFGPRYNDQNRSAARGPSL